MLLTLQTVEDTEQLGFALWQVLPRKCLLFLYGELGSGKTTLVRGMLRAAGYAGTVKSPTYSLVEEYQLNDRSLFHFDLYRLRDPEELEWMGMSDYLAQVALCCIEWPQMGQGWLPAADLEVRLAHAGEQRLADIKLLNHAWKETLKLDWKNKDLLL